MFYRTAFYPEDRSASSFERLVSTLETTRLHNPERRNLNKEKANDKP